MGSQKFTESERKAFELLEMPRVTKADIKSLSKEEMATLEKVVTEKVNSLKCEDQDRFIEKVSDLLTPESRNSIWEVNHTNIISHISRFIENNGRMPTKVELSQKTGLSRQTLNKHLKEYRSHPNYIDHFDQFRIMSERILTAMFSRAINGDVKAGRLYLEMIGGPEGPARGRRNYIQINNMILSQEAIKALDPFHLARIEEILREARVGETDLGRVEWPESRLISEKGQPTGQPEC